MSIKKLAFNYENLLANWVEWVSRRAIFTVLFASIITLIALIHFVLAFEINTSTTDMLAKDVPFRQYASKLDAAFPQTKDTLVVVIEGDTAGLADDAALALSARLRAMPELFEDVFDLRSEPFFRENGLLYLDIHELYDLSDKLAEAQPFIGTLSQERTLVGLFRMISLAVEEAVKPDGEMPLPLTGVFNDIADVADAQARGDFKVLDWSRLISEKETKRGSISERRRFIVLKPRLDFDSLQPAKIAIHNVRALARELKINQANGLRLRLTGSVALEQEELGSVETGMGLAVVVSLILVLIILLVGLGSIRLVFATLLTLIMGLIWTGSFAILSVGSLNLISVAFAVLFIGLSVDFGIHFGLRYREALDTSDDNRKALRHAAASVGGPLTLCALSASISFFAFLPTDYVGLAELGLIAGSGMFIALFANLTVLPAITSLLPSSKHGKKAVFSGYSRPLPTWIVIVIAIMLTLGSLALLPRVNFDFDPLSLKDPNSESVATLLDLMRDGARNYYSAEFLATDLEAAKEIASALETLPEVNHAMTLANFIPKEQDKKLEAISSLALFIGPSLSRVHSTKKGAGPVLASRRAWIDLERKLEKAIVRRPGALANAAKRMRLALIDILRDDDEIRELEKRLLDDLAGRLIGLRLALNARPVVLESLPEQLRRRWLAADGRALVEVFPRADLRDRQALKNFVTAVRHLAPHLSGTPVTVMEAGHTVLGAFMEAGVIAVTGICILLFVMLRRPIALALVFIPVLFAGLWTMALTVLSGLSFNLANVIILPLLFGLGVAGAIHLFARASVLGSPSQAMKTSTPRAVLLSALTTIGSFGSISLSTHPGTASMGILLMIAITMTVLATLVFLPSLMSLAARRQIFERT